MFLAISNILLLTICWPLFIDASPTNPIHNFLRISVPKPKVKVDEIVEEDRHPSPIHRGSSEIRQHPWDFNGPSTSVKPWPIPLDSCGIIGDEEMQNLLAESQSEIQLECENEKKDDDEEDPRILLDLGICHLSHSFHIVMDVMRMCHLDKALISLGEKCANICNKFGFPRCAAFINKEVKWWAENGGKMGEPLMLYALPGDHHGEKYPATAHVKKLYKVTRQLSGKLCLKLSEKFLPNERNGGGGQGYHRLPESLHDLSL